ncbi:hypothetical protein DNTS_035157 [Danionella cerebrum]|uniref:Uncharacterized protein n=1 Tax=Danionella cerebrum TaxID=2873325 RepID=A0A553N645_9TELE|nr:hypothetical protein DNTS_035157 [Danionella translucida]
MAFFGITHLGYQNPFADRMRSPGKNKLPRDPSEVLLEIQNSRFRRSPKDVYRVPVTDNQQYGWWIPTYDQKMDQWIQTRHFPRKTSEMTKFVNKMSRTNPDFSLF